MCLLKFIRRLWLRRMLLFYDVPYSLCNGEITRVYSALKTKVKDTLRRTVPP